MEQEIKEDVVVTEEKEKPKKNYVEQIVDIVKVALDYNSLKYGAQKDVLK